MRILVVEDDKKIASFVVKGLKEAGFAVDHADNGDDGLQLALKKLYDRPDVAQARRLEHHRALAHASLYS